MLYCCDITAIELTPMNSLNSAGEVGNLISDLLESESNMYVSALSGQLLLMLIGRGCLQKRNLLARLLFPQAILLLKYSAVK